MKLSHFIKDLISLVKQARSAGSEILAQNNINHWSYSENSVSGLFIKSKGSDNFDNVIEEYGLEIVVIDLLVEGMFSSAFEMWYNEEFAVADIKYDKFSGTLSDFELDRFYRMMNRCVASLEQEGY